MWRGGGGKNATVEKLQTATIMVVQGPRPRGERAAEYGWGSGGWQKRGGVRDLFLHARVGTAKWVTEPNGKPEHAERTSTSKEPTGDGSPRQGLPHPQRSENPLLTSMQGEKGRPSRRCSYYISSHQRCPRVGQPRGAASLRHNGTGCLERSHGEGPGCTRCQGSVIKITR